MALLQQWFGRLVGSSAPKMSEEDAARYEAEALSHLDALYRTALRFTRNAHDAEDLVQETYLKVFQHADRFEPGTNLRAWMFRILTNSFINRYRKSSRQTEDSLDDMEEFYLYNRLVGESGQNLSESAEKQVLERLVDIDIKRSLDELPENYRTPIVLHDIEGLSYKEIAEAMGVPIGTVMSRLSRGRKILQRSLWRYAQDSGFAEGEGVR
ncbi:MAG: sigma-70 family RNA polymerase sigma factor [Chloroflexota bacterium]